MSIVADPTQVTPTPLPPARPRKTIADLLHELGDIPAERVRLYPYPGTATEEDAITAVNNGYLCELVDGTLVEKPVGVPEAFLASLMLQFIGPFVRVNALGITTAPDGLYRMIHGNIREPDVSYTSEARLPQTVKQVGGWSPDLCVEILSPSNSKAEMARKRQEYFAAGTRLVWQIDPISRSVEEYTDKGAVAHFDETGTLDGGDVLPGFTLSLRELFTAFDVLYRKIHPTP